MGGFARRCTALPFGGEGAVRFGWLATYNKEVDAEEETIRFWQEIYDKEGRLVEIHEKYPLDKGHKKV